MTELPKISIDKDKWIICVALQGYEAFDFDKYLTTTKSFWTLLETNCLSGCCGLDAFDFWPDNIREAKKLAENGDFKDEFKNLRQFIFQRQETQLISDFLNCCIDKNVFLELLDHIILHL